MVLYGRSKERYLPLALYEEDLYHTSKSCVYTSSYCRLGKIRQDTQHMPKQSCWYFDSYIALCRVIRR